MAPAAGAEGLGGVRGGGWCRAGEVVGGALGMGVGEEGGNGGAERWGWGGVWGEGG